MTAAAISTDQLAAWRQSVARSDGTVAVVMGTFSMLQPGNLAAIACAKRRASHVCVLIDPASRQPDYGKAPCERAELVSFLRDVSAVCERPVLPDDARQLCPYIMADCLEQQGPGPVRLAFRAAAEEIAEVPALSGCFTSDIMNAIRNGQTPIPVPEFNNPSKRADLLGTAESWRRQGKTLVTVNGCFDILHTGHARMLADARRMGDRLIVLVNDDASVSAYKGKGRPVFPLHFRMKALRALGPVSMVHAFSGDNPLALLADIRPDIHVKGGSFEPDRVRAEHELLQTWGGRIEFCPMIEGYSTTRLIRAINPQARPGNQSNTIAENTG